MLNCLLQYLFYQLTGMIVSCLWKFVRCSLHQNKCLVFSMPNCQLYCGMNVLEVVWRNGLCYQAYCSLSYLSFSWACFSMVLFFHSIVQLFATCNPLLSYNLIASFWSSLQTQMHSDGQLVKRELRTFLQVGRAGVQIQTRLRVSACVWFKRAILLRRS
jgi:hypothetical protein